MKEEKREAVPMPQEDAEEKREEAALQGENDESETAEELAEELAEEGTDEDDGLGELFEIPQDEMVMDIQNQGMEVNLTSEEHREHALSVAEMAERMIRYEYQDRYYRKAIRELKPLFEEIPETLKEYKKYRRRMHNARANYRIQCYREACRMRDEAKTEEDFRYAAEKFEAIDRYDTIHHLNVKFCRPSLYAEAEQCTDSLKQAAFCRERQAALAEKRQKRVVGAFLTAAAVVVLLVLFSGSPWYLYAKGSLEELAGMPDKAWQAYYENYRITQDPGVYAKYQNARYKAVVKALKNGNGKYEEDSLAELAKKDYRDSRSLLADWEAAQVAAAEIGKAVNFAGVSWRVLDEDGTRRLLILGTALADKAFQKDGSPCTWETSDIRAWLNSDWLEKDFLPEEQERIVSVKHPAEDNPATGTSGGADTTDKVFLLSVTEAEKYLELMPETKRGWWLRTPGDRPGTMAFVSSDKTILEGGHEVSSKEIRVKAALWVDTAAQ